MLLDSPSLFINWLVACITTSKFFLVFTRNLVGYFLGKKGIKQGDPLSPYIFVIYIEVLSRMLNKAAAKGQFAYHHKSAKVKLTRLCFVDDLIIFTDGKASSLATIDDNLKSFYLFLV
ncbi:hypothetical protein SLA2020_523770 [Shorea laevis]